MKKLSANCTYNKHNEVKLTLSNFEKAREPRFEMI